MRTLRNGESEKYVKLSVTVPPRLARLAEEKVANGEASSVSAVVTQALARELDPGDDELTQLIREWIESGQLVISDENREWARKVLDL